MLYEAYILTVSMLFDIQVEKKQEKDWICNISPVMMTNIPDMRFNVPEEAEADAIKDL